MNNDKVVLCFRLLEVLTLFSAVTGLQTARLAPWVHQEEPCDAEQKVCIWQEYRCCYYAIKANIVRQA